MPTGFDRDDIGGDRTDGQRCFDAGDHVTCADRAMQEQNIDELAGYAGVTAGFAGRGPERVVGGG